MLAQPSSVTADFFDRARLQRLMHEHRAGHNDWSRILFQVFMLEHWGRELVRPLATPPLRDAHAHPVLEQSVQHAAGA